MRDTIYRSDAIEAMCGVVIDEFDVSPTLGYEVAEKALSALPSADAKQTMTEEVREALMRLTMCAREECDMCKYKDKCGFEFQYNISTENMHTILEALSAEAVQGWIPISDKLPPVGEDVLATDGEACSVLSLIEGYCWEDEYGHWAELYDFIAWMPLPRPYKGGDSECV